MTLKYKIEALLFSSGRRMNLEEFETHTKAPSDDIREALKVLEEEYKQRNSSIHIVDDGNAWKLSVKDEHVDSVRQVVTKTELSKSLLETLAVIAFKYPIQQADLIKIRTNKAYDHLSELEELGYITRQKFGRTRLIKLTEKFFEYFDLPESKLKEKFQDFEGIAKAITEKEEEIDTIKKNQKADAKKAGAEIDLVQEDGTITELEQFDEPEDELEKEKQERVQIIEDKVGDLEVVDVPELEEEEPQQELSEDGGLAYTEEMGEDVVDEVEGMVTGIKKKKSSQEVESDVDAKVEELLKKSTGSQEDTREATREDQEESEEPATEEEEPEDNASEDEQAESEEPPKKLEDIDEELQEEVSHSEPKKDPEKLEEKDKKE
ncbi:MAG: SMC-Scp complex subunit ScpB [Nanoarchaeota archaeon]|nr:SMC-Scp complex subunit ScpB [Nanoarchaeota archaeon]